MHIETQAGSFGISKNKADISVTTGGQRQALIRATGVMFAGLEVPTEETEGGEEESLCHRIEWIIDPVHSSSESLRNWLQQKAVSSSQDHQAILNQYCRNIIEHVQDTEGPETSTQALTFQNRLLKWIQPWDLHAVKDDFPVVEKDLLALGAPGEHIVKLGNRFIQALSGKASSPQFLLEGNLIYHLYADDGPLKRSYAHLANYIQLSRLKTPQIRILEIGTVPGKPSSVVGHLLYAEDDGTGLRARECSRFYADITTMAPLVETEFEGYDGLVEYRNLNFTQSLESQGFQTGYFDIIVAITLEQSTSDLPTTLTRLRSLMKPRGTIALVEIPKPSLKWQIISICQSSEAEQEHEASLLIASAVSPVSRRTKPVTIISCNNDDCIAGYLCSQLRSKIGNGSVTHTQLEHAVANDNIFIFLLELSQPFLQFQTSQQWQKIKEIYAQAGRVLWVTRNGALDCSDPANGLVMGFARSLRVEFPELRFITLDVDPLNTSEAQIVKYVEIIYAEKLGGEDLVPKTQLEWEFAIRNGALLVSRVLPHAVTIRFIEDSTSRYHPRVTPYDAKDRALALNIRLAGSFDTLHWADALEHSKRPGHGEIRVEMQAFSINARDVATAKGELEGNSTMLIEAVGTVSEVGEKVEEFSAGDVIYSFDPHGFATNSNIPTSRAIRVPPGMDIRTAVAVPLAYGTALHCLRDVARIQPGESIPIHSAAGAVGQATIALARYFQAGQVFVTVGGPEKSAMLQSRWGIPAANIFSSRGNTFGAGLLQRIHNHGVDIVINNLSGEAIHEGCAVLAPFGRFIEIGKRDLLSNGRLEMRSLVKTASFTTVDLTLVSEMRAHVLQDLFSPALMLINTSQVELFGPITVKSLSEIEETLRLVQSGQHVGKIVMEVTPDMSLKMQPSQPEMARLRDDASYLVVGGTGGLGKVIIRFLAKLGAKRVVTISRSGGGDAVMKEFAEEIRQKGVDLEVVQGMADTEALERIKRVAGKKVVRGVIHAATVFEVR